MYAYWSSAVARVSSHTAFLAKAEASGGGAADHTCALIPCTTDRVHLDFADRALVNIRIVRQFDAEIVVPNARAAELVCVLDTLEVAVALRCRARLAGADALEEHGRVSSARARG